MFQLFFRRFAESTNLKNHINVRIVPKVYHEFDKNFKYIKYNC